MVWCKDDGCWIVLVTLTGKEHWALKLREKPIICKKSFFLFQYNVKITIFHSEVFVFYLFGFDKRNLKIKYFFPNNIFLFGSKWQLFLH